MTCCWPRSRGCSDKGNPTAQAARNVRAEGAGHADTFQRLVWFVRLRWLAITGVLVAVPAAWFLLRIRFALWPVLAVTGWLAAYNTFFWWRLSRQSSIVSRQSSIAALAWAQIVLDLLALTGLLYFSGGIENPFSFYFVFHTAIAAIIFPGRESLVVTTLAFGLYALAVVLDHAGLIPHFPLTGLYPASPFRAGPAIVAGLFVFGSTLYIVRHLTASISRSLSRRTEELARANEKLRQADRNRLESVMMVTHELRSPAAAAASLLEVVSRAREEERAGLIERARTRINGLLKLTSDVLDLHQMELGEARFERRRLRIDRVVAEAVEELSALAHSGGISISAAGLDDLPLVVADPSSARFVVANLVANGIRYNRPGGSVTISGHRTGNRVELHVTDTGVGIPADELPHVFDIFYRGSFARQQQRQGTGLGLSLVKRLVQAHGGEVRVTSTEGEGSDFSFTLTVATDPESA